MNRHYLELIWYKALAELRAEAARAYLGFLWWVIEPITYMAAFYVVFVLILHRGGPNFVPGLLCGLVVWKWFGSTLTVSSNTIAANAALMQQVYLPKYLFPAIVIVINSLKFLAVFAVLLVFLLVYGIEPSGSWLLLPVLMLVQLLLISAVAGFVSAIVPFMPDLRLLLDNFLMLLFFLSGIFFDIKAVSADMQFFLRLNPMAVVIESYRTVLITGLWPDGRYLGIVTLVSVAGICLVGLVFRRYDRIYPKVLV